MATLTTLSYSCKRHHELNNYSNLIPIHEANGYVVPPDSMDAPISVEIDERKLKKVTFTNPRSVPVKSNVRPAILSKKEPLDTLQICIPGRGSFALPTKQTIIITPVPAPAPEIVLAKDMQVKDNNPSSFGIFKRLQGLKHPHVLNMMEDHHGNLWFCTAGAFTKYDGKFFSHFIIQKDIEDWTCYIHEDTSGHIWFGTSDKLVKYDGITFAQFNEINGTFPYNAYCMEKSGTIWSAVKSGGVNQITPAPGKPGEPVNFTLQHFGKKEGFTDQIIDKIIQDKSGHLWFIVRGGTGLIKLEMQFHDPDSIYTFLHFKTPDLLFEINAPDMLEDHDGNLWCTGSGGILKYDGDSLALFTDAAAGDAQMFPRMVDREGNIWGSIYMKGVFKYTPPEQDHSGTFTHFTMEDGLSSNYIDAILEDKHGSLWMGTLDGVNLYHGNVLSHLTKNEGLMYPEAMSILEDRSGNLWFGSSGYGVSRYDGNYFSYYDVDEGLCNSFVWSLLEDRNGNLWFGSIYDGVSRYTPSNVNGEGTFTNFAKENGLHGSVYDICEDHAGNIWFAEASLEARLYCYTPPKGNHVGHLKSYAQPQVFGCPNSNCIVEDHERNLWFGTDRGVTRYTPPVGDHPEVFCHFAMKEGLPDNDVRNIVKDYRGNLWFGTFGNGLIYYNGKSFVPISEKEGLSNNYVKSSLSDRAGNLWFGTNSGLNMLPKNLVDSIAEKVAAGTLSESDISFRTYMYEDGFLGISCNTNAIFQGKDGTIWVGTNDRVTAYHPEGDLRDTVPPNIQLTDIDLFNESINWSHLAQHQDSTFVLGNGVKVKNLKFDGLSSWYSVPEKLSLAHHNNNVTFQFIGITLDRPGSVKYQYRLDGQDPDWSALSSNNFATYGNLSPGKYNFRVKAMNSERYWSEERTYPFAIRSPWWHTWWAYACYALIVAATLYAIFYFFKRRLLLQQQLKSKDEEAIRLKELDTFKSQLFTNLTHEFRTPLTVILGMTKQLASGHWKSVMGQEVNDKVSQGLKLIENNGKNLLHLINQLLDLSKLENKSFRLHSIQSDIVPYLRFVSESFQSYADDHDLSLQFIPHVESLVMDFDPEQMKQILTNLISNALKFTLAGGEITIELKSSPTNIDIFVTDTGIGISGEDLPHVLERFYQADSSNTRVAQGTGIGLAHTQELLKVMGGNISIESELGKGTRVKVRLPVRHDAAVIGKDEITLTAIPHMSIIGLNKKVAEDLQTEIILEEFIRGSSPHVLLIEDSPDVVLYLRSCLEHAYEIDVAYDGKDGIEKAIEGIPDLIISDVMMPGKDGFQVCDTLKNDERTSHVPIILLTAKADAASRIAGLRRGADAYLSKPFDLEELLVRINMLLENRRRMAAYFSKVLQNVNTPPPNDDEVLEEIKIENAFVTKVNSIIEANYTDEDYALPQLCRDIGMSRSQLFRKMKAVADTAPSELIRSYRLHKAKAMLEKGDKSVAEVTYQVGFKDPSYFSKIFQEEFGVQPSAITK